MKKSLGSLGEDLGIKFLMGRGYRILDRNYRKPWGEIDIVAMRKDGTLIFVEVKALILPNRFSLSPEDHLTKAKLVKLHRICQSYIMENPASVREDRGWQIDLIAISVDASDANPSVASTEVAHYENV